MGYRSDVVLILKPGLEPPNYKDPDFPEDPGFLSRAEKNVSENGWAIYEWYYVKWDKFYDDAKSIIEFTEGLDYGDFELLELGEQLGDYNSHGTAQANEDCPFNVYPTQSLVVELER